MSSQTILATVERADGTIELALPPRVDWWRDGVDVWWPDEAERPVLGVGDVLRVNGLVVHIA